MSTFTFSAVSDDMPGTALFPVVDIIGGVPLPNCPYANSALPPDSQSPVFNSSIGATHLQEQAFSYHNPATTSTFMVISVASCIFGILTLANYNQVRIFNRCISHPSVLNREFAAVFFTVSFSYGIDTVRYMLNTSHASRHIVHSSNLPNFPSSPPVSSIVGPHIIDAWLLIVSSFLRMLAVSLASFALLKQFRNQSIFSNLSSQNSNQNASSIFESLGDTSHRLRNSLHSESPSNDDETAEPLLPSPDLVDNCGTTVAYRGWSDREHSNGTFGVYHTDASGPLHSSTEPSSARSHASVLSSLHHVPITSQGNVHNASLSSDADVSNRDIFCSREGSISLNVDAHPFHESNGVERDMGMYQTDFQMSPCSFTWIQGVFSKFKLLSYYLIETFVFRWSFLCFVLLLFRIIGQLIVIDSGAFVDSLEPSTSVYQPLASRAILATEVSPDFDQFRYLTFMILSILQIAPLIIIAFAIGLNRSHSQVISQTSISRVTRRRRRFHGPSSLTKILFIVGAILSCALWIEPSITSRLVQLQIRASLNSNESFEDRMCVVPPWWWLEASSVPLQEKHVTLLSQKQSVQSLITKKSIFRPKESGLGRTTLQVHGWASWIDLIQWTGFIGLWAMFSAMRLEYKRNMEKWVWITVSEVQNTFDFRQ
ncbi:hypothetical protein BATDEDRAFT_90540 [Batrachochytrium dendrobatidis JAM81]|uniref:Uncharacterized protein n=1 Tax=Batrachochytrium dendrobatidis (strain JAM81 / FGSC 10211) TaxID=684364 RepID=F4P853_BATDJ|nr:uncharacterized protein BATDEDRAFT_90540 [Batrachochytrium dendrobatidis JAM81]EGF78747.1 hypothetical protein BATDEDRAFT_90540 [Batrachochytrium dendrobatidis JAM81]|eukprot:XP_006680961.1 hypothetical protein BATDEDRAFT_90540 [Batrachochytrium dendrobatidis JAM81]